MPVQTNDVDTAIKQLIDNPTVIGYVVVNAEGIPVKFHEKMPYDQVGLRDSISLFRR